MYTFQGFDDHWRMACVREGQQSLVVQAKHRKDDDNKNEIISDVHTVVQNKRKLYVAQST
jgi:hypothetical protein